MTKRTVKLRGTEKFRRVGNRAGGGDAGGGIDWTSCKKIQYNTFRPRNGKSNGFPLTSGETKLLWAGVTFVLSAPLIGAFAVGSAVASTAQFAATQSGIGAGLLTALNLNNFLSKNIEKPAEPKFAKFPKPCIANFGGLSTNSERLKNIPIKNRDSINIGGLELEGRNFPIIPVANQIIGTIFEE
jgi:hypothetical protein